MGMKTRAAAVVKDPANEAETSTFGVEVDDNGERFIYLRDPRTDELIPMGVDDAYELAVRLVDAANTFYDADEAREVASSGYIADMRRHYKTHDMLFRMFRAMVTELDVIAEARERATA